MQIHLAKPGGEKAGPYTLEQIKQDLATKRYRDSDYWAWYEGADAWVPLYAIPGLAEAGRFAPPPPLAAVPPEPEEPAMAAETEPEPEPEPEPIAEGPSSKSEVASGIPFAALEQIFIFTSGEGPSLMKSPATASMLEDIIGEEWSMVRDKVPRDVFGRCDIGERVRRDGTVPGAAWRAMSALKPALIKQAQDGDYRTCVRTFVTEANEAVAAFLFYKQAE